MARAPVGAILQYLRKLTAPPADGEADRYLVRRFAATRDEAAFEAILRRHGGMVLGVCRRALGDPHEAEDAFQATFLVFIAKAGSLRRPELLGNWLYGTARRVAAKARVGAIRRWTKEAPLVDAAAPEPDSALEKIELGRAINEAVGSLPDKYRAPVVLCYLEGKTYTEAARVLGWAEGTVSGRLSRARDMLRRRLERTASPTSAGLLAPMASSALSNQPANSLTATVMLAALDRSLTSAVSLRATALAKGVLNDMFWSKMKLVVAGILMLGVTSAGAVAIGYGRAPVPDEGKPAAKETAAKVALKPTDMDDVASILHIYKQSGTVHFPGRINKAALKLAFYKAGQLVKQEPERDGTLYDVAALGEKMAGARFSLQIADLDYLRLGEDKKGYCRFQTSLQFVSAVSGSLVGGGTATADVPKDVFDFGPANAVSTLGGAAGSPNEIPLFYVLSNTNQFVGASTVADLIAKNQKADILIVSLRTPE